MPTTGEDRHKVAERLREAAVDDGHIGKPYGRQGFQTTLYGIIGASNPRRPTLYVGLAELIDPTCEFEESVENDELLIRVVSIYFCRACGHGTLVERPVSGPAEPPHYCSNCGTRLVAPDL